MVPPRRATASVANTAEIRVARSSISATSKSGIKGNRAYTPLTEKERCLRGGWLWAGEACNVAYTDRPATPRRRRRPCHGRDLVQRDRPVVDQRAGVEVRHRVAAWSCLGPAAYPRRAGTSRSKRLQLLYKRGIAVAALGEVTLAKPPMTPESAGANASSAKAMIGLRESYPRLFNQVSLTWSDNSMGRGSRSPSAY